MDGSSKFVGELGTVSCVSGSCNSVNLKPLCDSNESLSHNFGLENSMCVADVRFDVRTCTILLSVVAATCICAQATRAQPVARWATYSVSEIPSKRSFLCQKVLCREPSPVCEPLPFSAPNMIQSPLWMCALTGRRREVAWFHERVDLLLWETRP